MRLSRYGLFVLLMLVAFLPAKAEGLGPVTQPDWLIYNEMLTVYYGNVARCDNGVPPLRWNVPLTEAARWFSWDSVENRPSPYCGHEDTLGGWPVDRVLTFGYLGYGGAENCYCGYMEPQAAIDGWMNSPGHRANLLDPGSREIGMGYYLREADWRGYLTQDFGHDPVYPPMIIDNEAPSTADTAVSLYIYDREGGGGFRELGPATEMQVGNDPCFADAVWEPYRATKSWSLESGAGWRAVYVKSRDAVGRTTTVSDTIYLGSTIPLDELGLHLASTDADRVTLYGLDTTKPYVQLSQNWFVDDTFGTFGLNWGNGTRVSDGAAWGGTAFRLYPGDGESMAWVWTTEFFKNVPFTAYVRLKVNNNTSTSEVARFSVNGGGTTYGALSLKGIDFDAPNVYQEFPLDFTFHDSSDVFLIFNFWRSGTADVYVDGVTIYTRPQPVQSPLTWVVPGGNYRGGGVWLRYTDGAGNFTAREEALLTERALRITPLSLTFLAEAGGANPSPRTLTVVTSCGDVAWTATDNVVWLQTTAAGNTITVQALTQGLSTGTYNATVTVTADECVPGSPIHIPATLHVAITLYDAFLPLVVK